MPRTQIIDEQLNSLAACLRARREAILTAWREAADDDPLLTTADSLPTSQFNDHIPDVLETFERKLQAWPQEPPQLEKEREQDATTHGLQRWHQGYRLREVTREWGHLHLVLNDELERYALSASNRSADAMAIARRMLVELCAFSVSESTAEYFRLEEIEAEGHVRDLAHLLKEERALDKERAELWRQAAHDLRGHVGVVVNATTGLAVSEAPSSVRDKFLSLLQKSTKSLHRMLDEVMDLTRLQAGHEQLDNEPFDAAHLLQELCDELQSQADERGLYLKRDGPGSLPVEGDALKIRRIAQNLLINALKYTETGGVSVSWGDSRKNDSERWIFSVQDTGPGFHAGPGAPLVNALKTATRASQDVDRAAGVSLMGASSAADNDPRPTKQQRGEGIGLSIVKRLGDLLNATIELESAPEIGTTFRVILPRRYPRGEPTS
ncbi:MAG: sensor histidine kinase [Burkholderiaceae bacterium]